MTNSNFPRTTVGALVTNPDDEVLIVKTTKWRGQWGVPGGKVEWGETLEEALVREFQEEVGLHLREIHFALIQEAIFDPQFYQNDHFIMINYYAMSLETTIIPNEEIEEWTWLSPQATLHYPLNSYTQKLVQNYLLFKEGKC